MKSLLRLSRICGLALATTAHAHQVWIERDKQNIAVYYGEYAEGHREVAGGELDKIASPVLYQGDASRPLTITRGTDRLTSTTEAVGDVRVVEAGMPPFRGRRNSTKYVFAGKAGRTETRPVHVCEIVPTRANGNVFTVVLNGTVVPDAKITVVTPDRWMKSFPAGDKGEVAIETPGKGLFLLEATVSEDKAGGEGEGAFDKTVHVITLTFVVE